MNDEPKGIAMVILGIVAVIAVVGVVLLFTGSGATGQGVYGGAIKNIKMPYQDYRGIPLAGLEDTGMSGHNTHWNYYGIPVRSPQDVPSIQTACGPNAIRVPYGQESALSYYESSGRYACYSDNELGYPDFQIPGKCCFQTGSLADPAGFRAPPAMLS